jgi:hypothetical protein
MTKPSWTHVEEIAIIINEVQNLDPTTAKHLVCPEHQETLILNSNTTDEIATKIFLAP